jgi:DNA-directed RNA polymerase specialized sigma24 family protein
MGLRARFPLLVDAPPAADHVSDTRPPGLDDLFQLYAPYVATIGFRLLGRDHELDDLVQDVFIEAHRGLHQLRDLGAA